VTRLRWQLGRRSTFSGDPVLDKLWPKMSYLASVRTTPPGAAVFRRNFSAQNNGWELVGRSPFEKYRLPSVDSQWRFEFAGFVPVERSTFFMFGSVLPSDSISVKLDADVNAPPGMIHQTSGTSNSSWLESLEKTPVTLVGLPGFEDAPEILLKDYWIDRYEVTNKQFKEFIDQGGYRKPEFWKHPFNKDGRNLSWQAAIEMFRDSTGRPGPATWALSDYPRGQDDFPVSGVSWYEAAAYADFAGKALPTIYHWATAASPWAASLLPVSNFSTQGPARVGSFRSMSWFGAYDMAGNVKEGRSIDYLETRPEIDARKLAYQGFSWGGQWAPSFRPWRIGSRCVCLLFRAFTFRNHCPRWTSLTSHPASRFRSSCSMAVLISFILRRPRRSPCSGCWERLRKTSVASSTKPVITYPGTS
jgi:hypothetical protein